MTKFSDDYKHWWKRILKHKAPDGTTPQGLPGGKEAVKDAGNTDLSNDNMHEGVWFHATCDDGKPLALFFPDETKIVGRASPLWTAITVQEDTGVRYSYAPYTVLYMLKHGYPEG